MCSHIDMHTHVAPYPVPISIAKVKTQTRGLGLGFDLWPFDLRVTACQGPAMDHTSTDFGADSSSHFLLECGQTDRQTDASERPTPRWQLYSRCG